MPQRPLRILITSFEPFAGRATNNSEAIAGELRANPALLGGDLELLFCALPVVYDQAATVAMDCVERYKPDAVVSLGEADCRLRLETAASNRDDSPDLPDNAGQVRVDHRIVPSGPERVGFRFPVEAMYRALGEESSRLEVSSSPGSFVCNNVAYHMTLGLAPRGVPYAFIHVPSGECEAPIRDPQANARAIALMLQGAVARLRSPDWATARITMPATRDEAAALLQSLKASGADGRAIQFATRLFSHFEMKGQDHESRRPAQGNSRLLRS